MLPFLYFSAWYNKTLDILLEALGSFHFSSIFRSNSKPWWNLKWYQWVFLPVEGRIYNHVPSVSEPSDSRRTEIDVAVLSGPLHSVCRESAVSSRRSAAGLMSLACGKLTCLHTGLQLDSPWRETDWLPLQMEINHKFLHVYRQGFMSISALLFWNIHCNYGETRPLRARAALLWQVHFLLQRVGVHKGDLHISAPAQITASCFSALFKHAKQHRHCLGPRH